MSGYDDLTVMGTAPKVMGMDTEVKPIAGQGGGGGTPTTEAGKRMLREARPKMALTDLPDVPPRRDYREWAEDRIAAIEAEAVAAERARIRAAVKGLPGYPDGLRLTSVRRESVLRIIEGEAS